MQLAEHWESWFSWNSLGCKQICCKIVQLSLRFEVGFWYFCLCSSNLYQPGRLCFVFNVVEFPASPCRPVSWKGVCTGWLAELVAPLLHPSKNSQDTKGESSSTEKVWILALKTLTVKSMHVWNNCRFLCLLLWCSACALEHAPSFCSSTLLLYNVSWTWFLNTKVKFYFIYANLNCEISHYRKAKVVFHSSVVLSVSWRMFTWTKLLLCN